MLKQKTLKDSFSLSGKGLHTGLELTVTFNPAPDNHGYKIQRVDMEGQPIIDAVADNVVETTRGTVLAKGDASVITSYSIHYTKLYDGFFNNWPQQITNPRRSYFCYHKRNT